MIYQSLVEDLDHGQKIYRTQTQLEYIHDGFSYSTLDILLHKALPVRQRNTIWRLFNKTLPLFHRDKTLKPNLESTTGIFFDNIIASRIIHALCTRLKLPPLKWSRHRILNASSDHPILPGTLPPMLNTLWWYRNQSKHSNIPTENETFRKFKAELTKTVRLTKDTKIYSSLFGLSAHTILYTIKTWFFLSQSLVVNNCHIKVNIQEC